MYLICKTDCCALPVKFRTHSTFTPQEVNLNITIHNFFVYILHYRYWYAVVTYVSNHFNIRKIFLRSHRIKFNSSQMDVMQIVHLVVNSEKMRQSNVEKFHIVLKWGTLMLRPKKFKLNVRSLVSFSLKKLIWCEQ